MSRPSYKLLLSLYANHVQGQTGETFLDQRCGGWTDEEWAALVEIRNELERMNRLDADELAIAASASPASAPA